MEYLDPATNEKYHPLLRRAFRGRGPCWCWPSCATPTRRRSWRAATCAPCCTCIPRWRPSRPPCCPCRRTSWASMASEIYEQAVQAASWCDYDETGSIGKRYRRQDEIGTPFCICVDFDTEDDRQRHRARPRHHAAGAREGGRSGSLHCPAGEVLSRFSVPFSGRCQISDQLSPPIFENRTNGFRQENAAGLSNLRGTAL